MPSFEWSLKHNAYIKSCVSCDEVFIGTKTQQESETIFAKNFGVGGRSNLDGLYTSCNLCRSGKVYGYKISHKDKRALYERQDRRCAICSMPIDYDKARVDHCHTTGRIRGLLHTQCNSQLGFYERYKEQITKYLGDNIGQDN